MYLYKNNYNIVISMQKVLKVFVNGIIFFFIIINVYCYYLVISFRKDNLNYGMLGLQKIIYSVYFIDGLLILDVQERLYLEFLNFYLSFGIG